MADLRTPKITQDVSFGNYLCDGFVRHFTAADSDQARNLTGRPESR